MNKKFVSYLKLLESRAPASRKADFHNAIALYMSRASKARLEADELPVYGRSFSNFGNAPAQNTFANIGTSHGNATRSPDMVKADTDRANEIRKAEEGFPTAANTVLKAAEVAPGKIDAWVDYRLEPAIKRARKAGREEGSDGYSSDYRAAKNKYKAEDKEARETARREQEEALARSREEAEYKKQQEERKAEEQRNAEAAKKREELGSNRDYNKYSAELPLNASDKDINRTVATARSDDMSKDAEVDKSYNDAMKWLKDNGEDYGMFGESVTGIKGLRAAFESVYGDSSEFTDSEIRTICESCYRRSRKK